ncbi:hypothetical protein RHMOL_Rhmol06G0134500 [Rhododendron molle]|uniref:Uncharacterized protein n=1 Tax=Rhododendron molle TaxID=49168 RepID=A0ACC0ND14_RHOML|nr:hypothetical protein RHMOL_Rhmol06G0134500 [Rhododendron molle]
MEKKQRAVEEARAVEPVVQPLDPSMEVAGSVVAGRSSRDADHGSDGRASDVEPHATEEAGAMGPSVEPVGLSTVARGSPVVERSSGSAGGSGAEGDDLGLIESPSRDPTRGKGAAMEEECTEVPVSYREEDVLFRPVATSSSHWPITKYNIAEHLPDEALAKLLEDSPAIGELVLKAKEERARAIASSKAAKRAERERKEMEEPLRDAKVEKRAGAEAQGPQVKAVAEAGAMTRPAFSAEAYIPPTPHLFVLSSFAAFAPRRTEYDAELALRDPETHIANTWTEIPRVVQGPATEGEAGFGEFIQTLTPVRNDHAVLVALVERWRDTTNTFHLPPGEITVTPTDFAAITGLRVGRVPIPFDSGIHNDRAALKWFLGKVPKIEEGMVRRSKLHSSYLPALRDLRMASRFDYGRAALVAAYDFLGDSSRTEQSTAGYWRVWEVPGPLPPRASHTGEYTRAELKRFTQPDTELTRYLRPEMDYAAYQRDRLAGALGVWAFRDVRSQARGATEEMRATGERQRGGEGRVRRSLSGPVRGGPPEMSWKISVMDTQGNPAEIHLVPARAKPASVTVPVHGQAASRSKRTRPPSQKQIVTRTPTPLVTTRRQTRSSLLVDASQEATRRAVTCAE